MKLIGSVVLLCVSIFSMGQKPAAIFYDADWKITTREEAAYFRTCIVDTAKLSFLGEVSDYYYNGQLEMRGTYKNYVKVDSFFFYYANGKLESKGVYQDNLRQGIWNYFYENGKLKQTVEFFESDFTIKEYYDSLGKPMLVNGTGTWHHQYKIHDLFNWIRVEGEYRNGKRDGNWKSYTTVGDLEERLEYTDKFKDGKLRTPWYAGSVLSVYYPDKYKFRMTEEFHYSVFVSRKNYPFVKKLPSEIDSLKLPYEANATFPGGEKELSKFLTKNVVYPKLAKSDGVEKKLYVEFIVDKGGKVTNVTSPKFTWDARYHKYGFEEEIIRVVELFPLWTPARRDNMDVPQRQVLSVNFTIREIKMERANSGALRALSNKIGVR